MLSNQSKQKLINSFNTLTTALYNLRTDIATEGKKAFINCDTQDINELMVLMTKVNEIGNKIDKIAPSFKTYALDVATDTHPAEFPIENIKAKTSILFPLTLTIQVDNKEIECLAESQTSFLIKPPLTFNLNSNKLTKSAIERLDKLVSTGSITIKDDEKGNRLVIVNKEIRFKSPNSLASFLIGKTITNGLELLMVNKEKRYKTILLERQLGS